MNKAAEHFAQAALAIDFHEKLSRTIACCDSIAISWTDKELLISCMADNGIGGAVGFGSVVAVKDNDVMAALEDAIDDIDRSMAALERAENS